MSGELGFHSGFCRVKCWETRSLLICNSGRGGGIGSVDVLLSQMPWRGWGWGAATVGSAGCGKGTALHVVWVLGEKGAEGKSPSCIYFHVPCGILVP